MTAVGLPEAWKEFCLISIIPEAFPAGAGGGTAISFEGLTENITALDWGEKAIEAIPLTNGGRIVKPSPMGEEGITMKMYPTDAAITANGLVQLFHPQTTADATQPIVVNNSIYRRRFGIIILWASTLPATATTLPATNDSAYRIQVINAYMTGYKLNYDDKMLSAEVTFKWGPFNKSAVGNKREESTDGGTQLAASITTATSF